MSSCAAGGSYRGGGVPLVTPEDLGAVMAQLREAWVSMSPRAQRGRGGGSPGGGGWPGHGPWGGGSPFGPEFPFGKRRGPGPGWSFDGRHRPRAARGDTRLAILALLQEGPRHGYQLIQDIRERSDNTWNPSPGSIYPALSALQDEGLIDDEKLDGRRVFSLTDAGSAYVADRAEDLQRVFADNTASPEPEDLTDLRDLVWGVGGAAITVIGSGTEEQRVRAREILARTRRELYRLLSEEGDEGPAASDVDEDDPDPGQKAAPEGSQ